HPSWSQGPPFTAEIDIVPESASPPRYNHETHLARGGGLAAGGGRSGAGRDVSWIPRKESDRPPVPGDRGRGDRGANSAPWGKPPAGRADSGTGGLAAGAGGGGGGRLVASPGRGEPAVLGGGRRRRWGTP